MTMTRDEINELIKLVDNNQERIENVLHEDEDAAVMMIKQALTEYRDSLDRFDVLQHLRDGGKATRKCWAGLGAYVYLDKRRMMVCEGASSEEWKEGSYQIVKYDDWQPYEPPVEDMLEDGCFYWINLLGQKSVCVWDAKHYENGAFIVGTGHWHSIEKGRCEPIMPDGKPIKVEVPE